MTSIIQAPNMELRHGLDTIKKNRRDANTKRSFRCRNKGRSSSARQANDVFDGPSNSGIKEADVISGQDREAQAVFKLRPQDGVDVPQFLLGAKQRRADFVQLLNSEVT